MAGQLYELDALGWAVALAGLIAVAAATRQLALDTGQGLQSNPVPSQKRLELEQRYGRWALETAIAVCPHEDIECIEREAKRLYEVRTWRRSI